MTTYWQEYKKQNEEKLKKYYKKYREENKEKIKERDKKYREENKEKIKTLQTNWYNVNITKIKEKQKKYREENKEKSKITKLLKRYNLSIEEYENLIYIQDNKCSICLNSFDEVKKVVDHCHITNKVRGLLCHSCNTGIGLLKENKEVLQNAIAYLSK